MWWTILIVFILISIISSTLLYFSLRRINQYEDLIVQFEQIIEFSNAKVKQLDEKGTFEADDEVGFFFQQLKDLQSLLNNLFELDRGDIRENDSDTAKK